MPSDIMGAAILAETLLAVRESLPIKSEQPRNPCTRQLLHIIEAPRYDACKTSSRRCLLPLVAFGGRPSGAVAGRTETFLAILSKRLVSMLYSCAGDEAAALEGVGLHGPPCMALNNTGSLLSSLVTRLTVPAFKQYLQASR